MSLVQTYAVYFIIVSAYCVGKSINKPTSKTCDLGTVTNQLFELYSTTAKSINKLVKIGKKEFFPTFFPILSRRCWGYLDYNKNKSPFPTSSLTILKKFKGSKFNRQTYKVFLPFVLAMNDVLKNTNVPAQAPVNLMKDIDMKLTKVIVCLQKSEPTFQAYFPSVRYNTAIHKADVKTCLDTVIQKRGKLLDFRKAKNTHLFYAFLKSRNIQTRKPIREKGKLYQLQRRFNWFNMEISWTNYILRVDKCNSLFLILTPDNGSSESKLNMSPYKGILVNSK